MDWNQIYQIFSTISLIVGIYLTVRDFMLRRQKAPSEKDANISAAIQNLSSALGLTSNELVEALTDSAKLRDELAAEREATRKRVEETIEYRLEQERKISELQKQLDAERQATRQRRDEYDRNIEGLKKILADLQTHIESTEREYAKETARLGDENASLKRQVDELRTKYENAKSALVIMNEAMNKANIDTPSELHLLLGDSIQGLRWPPKKP